jgi:hypothetical protein
MAIEISDLAVLHQYINGVMGRADHHAQAVNEIALVIAGAVAWRCNSMHAFEREGEMKNVLRFFVNNQKYTLSYDHDKKQIVLKQGSIQGNEIARFDNNTPISIVKRTFELLQ